MPSLSPELLEIQERLDPKAYNAELESMLAERLTVMQEREQLIRRLRDEAGVLRAVAEERLTEVQRKDGALAELKKGFERHTARLERIAAERLNLLVAADRDAAEARAEAERREAARGGLTAAIQQRDRRIEELQNAAQCPEGTS